MSTKQRNLGDILQEFSQHRQVMQQELQKVIVGQDEVIEQLFAAIFTRGHCLLEGVPGLAKTLMVSTLAQILDVGFKRIQFTPDLMPSDITGTNVLEEDERGGGSFRFVEGPIFTNILLADEINRTPPKTQAALLQAMQEREVTVGRDDLRAARSVLHDRHAEPDRAGGNLSAARSPARPLHVQHQGRLSHRRRRKSGSWRSTTPQREGGSPQGALGAGDRQSAEAGQLGGGQRVHRQVRGAAGAGDAAAGRVGAGVRPRAGRLGRRAAGRAVPDQRRQGAWRPWTAGSRSPSTTSGRSPSPCCGIAISTNFQAQAEGHDDRRRHRAAAAARFPEPEIPKFAEPPRDAVRNAADGPRPQGAAIARRN